MADDAELIMRLYSYPKVRAAAEQARRTPGVMVPVHPERANMTVAELVAEIDAGDG